MGLNTTLNGKSVLYWVSITYKIKFKSNIFLIILLTNCCKDFRKRWPTKWIKFKQGTSFSNCVIALKQCKTGLPSSVLVRVSTYHRTLNKNCTIVYRLGTNHYSSTTAESSRRDSTNCEQEGLPNSYTFQSFGIECQKIISWVLFTIYGI